jgi:hypothetical protein
MSLATLAAPLLLLLLLLLLLASGDDCRQSPKYTLEPKTPYPSGRVCYRLWLLLNEQLMERAQRVA